MNCFYPSCGLIFALLVSSAPVLAQQQGMPVMDDKIYSMILVDQLEHGFGHRADTLRFNGQAWIGGDYNRIWINTEGARRYNGALEDADVQVLYGRSRDGGAGYSGFGAILV